MSLTRDQERFISEYLRDVALKLGPSVDESRAQRGMDLLEKRIRRTIASKSDNSKVLDSDVVRVLDDLGSPAEQAELMRPGGEHRRAAERVKGQEVWLGVCAYWADRLQIPVLYLRIGVVAVCCLGFTAPLMVLAYIGAYAHRWWTMPEEVRPQIDWVRLAWNVGTCLVIAYLLSLSVEYALWGIEYSYQRVFDEPLPSAGEYGWIRYSAPGYYWQAVWCAVPLAVLSGLPLARGWDYSLKRLYLAILTIYGVMLSYGMASFVVGILLELVQQYDGADPTTMLREFLPDSLLP